MPSSSSFNTYSNLLNPEFRAKIDAMLAQFEAAFYAKIDNAQEMLKSDSFDLNMYKRHNVETILRIALKRAVDPMIANYWAPRDPQLCKEWGLYGAEEGRHDRMFARDLHDVGMTDDEIYATRPTFATELLNGYFYYTMATEGPLASMVSGFYLEFVAGRTQPDWLDSVEVHLGPERTKGARRHLQQDLDDDHVNMVWNMIMRTIKTPADEARFVEHLVKINALFVSYFVEVARSVREPKPSPLEAAMTAPVAAISVAAEAAGALS
ncbi:conserved protein of unknown function [Burkholderia multivorans]